MTNTNIGICVYHYLIFWCLVNVRIPRNPQITLHSLHFAFTFLAACIIYISGIKYVLYYFLWYFTGLFVITAASSVQVLRVIGGIRLWNRETRGISRDGA